MFVRCNHHRETTVFGECLMYNETFEYFIWLFETFLQVMLGKAPKTILIDRDVAMIKTFLHVMPNTYHKLYVNVLKHVHDIGIKYILSTFMFNIEDEMNS